MTMTTTRRGVTAGMTLAALALAAVAACSGDDDPAAAGDTTSPAPPPSSVPGTTAAPVTTATTVAPTATASADERVRAELQAALDAYDEAYASATAAPGDPTHVDLLAATTDGDLRQGVQAAIADRRAAGEALRPGSSGVALDQRIDTVESVGAAEATVVTCLFNGSERYVVATDTVLDGSQVAWTNRVTLRRGDDGLWRVAAGERVGDRRDGRGEPMRMRAVAVVLLALLALVRRDHHGVGR